MSTAEASKRLGVSPQRVRALWHNGILAGQLTANRLLLDRTSVLDLADRERPATRPLSARNAWSLLLILAGQTSPWATPSEMSRLRSLAFGRDERALAALVRARAQTFRFGGAPGSSEYVLRDKHVVPGGATLAHRWTDLIADGVAEVYVCASAKQSLADRLRLWRDPQGPIVVHAVPDHLGEILLHRTEMPASVVAADLLGAADPRSHRSGETLWGKVLEDWRETAPPLRVSRESGRR